ncbi:MAG: SGNH/GDSL hydrolase family protein [Verrucomicrobiota bacterium]
MKIFILILFFLRFFSLASAEDLSVVITPHDSNIRYVGRFDFKDPAGPQCAWSASSIKLQFEGKNIEAVFQEQGQSYWQVFVDGVATIVIPLQEGRQTYPLATDLPETSHTIELVKRTEARVGVTQFLGFKLIGNGRALPSKPLSRRIEVIGDSISCGFGNEATSKEAPFTPETENASLTYGFLAARQLNAEYLCVAWSGKKMWPDNTIPELYERILPNSPESQWDFTQWIPDAVVINLATNDFRKENPDEKEWTKAYINFVKKIRTHYPNAIIYCSSGPMISDGPAWKPLTTLQSYLRTIISTFQTEGDIKVQPLEFETQKESDGIGAQWHPSLKTHQMMNEKLKTALAKDLEWK